MKTAILFLLLLLSITISVFMAAATDGSLDVVSVLLKALVVFALLCLVTGVFVKQ